MDELVCEDNDSKSCLGGKDMREDMRAYWASNNSESGEIYPSFQNCKAWFDVLLTGRLGNIKVAIRVKRVWMI